MRVLTAALSDLQKPPAGPSCRRGDFATYALILSEMVHSGSLARVNFLWSCLARLHFCNHPVCQMRIPDGRERMCVSPLRLASSMRGWNC